MQAACVLLSQMAHLLGVRHLPDTCLHIEAAGREAIEAAQHGHIPSRIECSTGEVTGIRWPTEVQLLQHAAHPIIQSHLKNCHCHVSDKQTALRNHQQALQTV